MVCQVYYLFHPKHIRIFFFAVSEQIIAPEKQFVEPGRVADAPSDKTMKPSVRLIEGTGPDTVGAICSVGRPERQAGFPIDRPPKYTFPV